MSKTPEATVFSRVVTQYLIMKGFTVNAIHEELVLTQAEDAPSFITVARWAARFRAGDRSIEDKPRSGRPPLTGLDECLRDHLEEDPHATLRSAAAALNVSHVTVRTAMQQLGLRYHCTRWVPHALTDANRQQRVQTAEDILGMLEEMTDRQLANLVTADESWFFHDNPHDGRWSAADEPPESVPRQTVSSAKSFVCVFWTMRGPLLVSALEKGETFTSETAVLLLGKLDAAMRTQGRAKVGIRGMRMHWDNARPHFSKLTLAAIDRYGLKIVPHPPYSPDLAPSDFFLFGYLKNIMKGEKIPNKDVLEQRIWDLMAQIPETMMQRVTDSWKKRLRRVIELEGDYYSK